MCGISGIVDFEGGVVRHLGAVSGMTRALAHRGPDDEGSWHDDTAAFGFRRLAVIDLETGRQPIRLADDRLVIVLNGEIYNYRELRRELEPRHRFRTQGDVEVVLHLWSEMGSRALERLDGMFALALWDRERRTLHLARDRFGIKPLYLYRRGPLVAFASEVVALTVGGFPPEPRLDRRELRHYLAQKHLSPTGSIFEDVVALPPATALEIRSEGVQTRRYWEAPVPLAPHQAPADPEAVEHLGALVERSARSQLVADVPVGIFLSGGIDSGVLTAAVRRVEPGVVRTFSVGFANRAVADELPRAAELAALLGTEHHELRLDPRRVAVDLPQILGALDGPLGDATAVPTWYMSRFARGLVTVALAGEGADELFGGYGRQRYDVWLDRLGPVGRRLVPPVMRLTGRHPSARLRARLHMPPGLERQLDWSRVFSAAEIDALTAEPLPAEDEVRALHGDLGRRWHERARVDALGARLETDRELFLAGDLLPKVDRMSMAHSLEVRVPYLGNDLADFALALPGRMKVRGRTDKWLLRQVASKMLGSAHAARPKQGFDVPIGAWQREALGEVVKDVLSEASVERRGLFRPAAVTRLVREHLAGAVDHGERLWLLVALEGWLSAVGDRRGARVG